MVTKCWFAEAYNRKKVVLVFLKEINRLALCRCGDILLEVNGKSTWGMTHTALVRLLKELRGRITLTIVSWPGSLL